MKTVNPTGPSSAMRPDMEASLYLTDGGLETYLVFLRDIDLPEFASFPLLDSEEGVRELQAYFDRYLAIAERDGQGLIIDTPTWRANRDWGNKLGYDTAALASINRRAVDLCRTIATRHSGVPSITNGVVGPRGDGYVVDALMSTVGARKYHTPQIQAFADAGVEMVSAVTMTYAAEAAGIAQAAIAERLPVVIGFTVETDGTLPSGQPLRDAIAEVDDITDRQVAWYLVNCAHPSHFSCVLDPSDPVMGRIESVRANASRCSHEELDAASELDRGNPNELAADYVRLRDAIPGLRVVGGCCGTDADHISAISAALAG